MSKVRSDNISNRADDGAPKLVFGAEVPVGYGITGAGGINITGVATAASFSGNATSATTATTATNAQGLTGTPNITINNLVGAAATFTGVLTYEDVTNIDSIGIITARSDVSIADKIIHTGDTNTAIRFPAADTFTVETAGTERVRVDSSGRTLINTSSSIATEPDVQGYTPALQVVHAPLNGGTNGVSINRFQAGNSFAPPLIFQKSKNDTIGSHTIVADNDELGDISFAGSDGAAFRTAARINVDVDGTPGSSDMPGRIQFSTTANGAATPTERLRITSAGAAIFKGGLAEKYENAGTTLGSQPNNPLSDGNVILFTGNESGNKTINFTGVHSTLSNGETVSFTAIITPNNSGKITVAQVDGQAITIKWSGGSVPTAGSSGQDIYTFQILKTGTGVSDYTIFGAAANYA